MTSLILFGAFDRHNFGDMLFAHIAERLIAEQAPARAVRFAGLAARDLRAHGGHEVAPLGSLMTNSPDEHIALLHVGGELLTCDAWEAAVMLASPDDAHALIATHGGNAHDRTVWARATLGIDARAPYVIGRTTYPQAAWIGFTGIGGASLDARDERLRAEVLSALRTADDLSVRDASTQAALKEAGIASRLAPDPVSMIATLFDECIRERGRIERSARVNDYLAVQLSADFGDDATLSRLAAQLDALNHSIVLFRAGAAPWHDDLDVYARLLRRMHRNDVTIFDSLNVWDTCALIAHSAGFIGSSLHGRIVAMAYALPRVNLLHAHETKQSAYAASWDLADMPGAVSIDALRDAFKQADSIDQPVLERHAATLAEAYRADFARTLASLSFRPANSI